MIRLLTGDCREVLRTLPDESVHCVVTSPPYYGLRDYGTAKWEGGDAECDHKGPVRQPRNERPLGAFHSGTDENNASREPALHAVCPRCGARRIDNQIGLEATPAEYIANLVAVFREVKRVLHPSGVVFLNLGSSYASSTSNRNQSRLADREAACDSDGTEQSDCQEIDPACLRFDDARQGDSPNHPRRNSRNGLEPDEDGGHPCMTDRGNGHQDSTGASLDASVPCAQASTTLGSSLQPLGASSPEATALACQCEPPTDDGAIPLCAHTAENTTGTSSQCGTSVCHKSDTGLSSKASQASYVSTIDSLLNAFSLVKFKSKDLIMIPSMVALALQADGWYVRSEICWAKKAPMPESVTDRCTRSHEMVYMLAKNARYFCDMEAVRQPLAESSVERLSQPTFDEQTGGPKDYGHRTNENRSARKALCNLKEKLVAQEKWGDRHEGWAQRDKSIGANLRDVWFLSPEPQKLAHFAVFPTELARRCIAMGTSERGCCPKCLAPYERIVENSGTGPQRKSRKNEQVRLTRFAGQKWCDWKEENPNVTTGWRPTCDCCTICDTYGQLHGERPCNPYEPVPATVLDPFGGSGTVGLVADRLGRDAILIDLNPEYSEMQRQRVTADAGMFAQVAGGE